MPIEIDNILKVRNRVNPLRKLLKPLSHDLDGPAIKVESNNDRIVVLAAHGGGITSSEPYRDLRFSTTVKELNAAYFEIWKKADNNRYFLDRAYLGLYQLHSYDEIPSEFLALHCDPYDKGIHSDYKRGPHLHVMGAQDPFPHAHLALNLCHLEEVLANTSKLFEAYGKAVQMIRFQILDAMNSKQT